jgi:hypothetical protein
MKKYNLFLSTHSGKLVCFIFFLILLSLSPNSYGQSDPSPEQTVCTGNEPYLVTGTTGSAYNWSVTPGSSGSQWRINGTGNSVTVDWLAAGIYTLSVTETSSAGCPGTPSVVTVTVNPLPSASISGSATVCQDSDEPFITFTGIGASGPYTFTYTINGGASQTVSTTSGNSVTVPVSTTAAGTFIYNLVSVQYEGAQSCIQPVGSAATVSVVTAPVPAITQSVSPVCFGSEAVYTTESGMSAYTWVIIGGSVVSGGSGSDNNVRVIWDGSAPYSVSVNYTSPAGCAAATPELQNISVTPPPVTSPIYHN